MIPGAYPHTSSVGTFVNDYVFGLLGFKGGAIGAAIDGLTGNTVGQLQNLQDAYLETAYSRGTGPIERRMLSQLAPYAYMPSPMAAYPHMAPLCASAYAGAGPLAAMQLAASSNMNPAAQYMMAMQTAALGCGGGAWPGAVGNPFAAYALGGFSRMLGTPGPAGAGFSPWDNTGPLGGRGYGSWNPFARPGLMNNTNPRYEAAHQMQVSSILADPSLTVEDKIALMLMAIMSKMDDDIERQAQYINSLQQQQGARPGEQPGTLPGAYPGMPIPGAYPGMPIPGMPGPDGMKKSEASTDIEVMKLKRMIEKRGEMFDMLRQIIDKYNQTARGIIQSIGHG